MRDRVTGCLSLFVVGLAGCMPTPEDPVAADVARIYAHLTNVETSLRERDVSHLSRTQRSRRAEVLDWLVEYRETRVYPHNHVVMEQRVPVFVDPHGTPCAVGYLILRSGEQSLVEEVVRSANLARVPELAGDPRLTSWLDAHGLTLAEATEIQPAYGGWEPPQEERGINSAYVASTVGFGVASAATMAYGEWVAGEDANLPLLGAFTLALAAGHGYLAALGYTVDSEQPRWAAGTNLAAAGIATVVGLKLFHRAGLERGAARGVAFLPTITAEGEGMMVGFSLLF
ncbi:MAG: hypothetical protein OEZ65_09845 [Gemmatimonadota bacterium]|nr:hypothetical protein [Gemmatimonadota bacterium]MDH5759879.1 hypothetical protein [Gemmatimonadota bacterium]